MRLSETFRGLAESVIRKRISRKTKELAPIRIQSTIYTFHGKCVPDVNNLTKKFTLQGPAAASRTALYATRAI